MLIFYEFLHKEVVSIISNCESVMKFYNKVQKFLVDVIRTD